MTRGSCRAGSVNRVVSGATASQPTKESMRVEAACPTACQPCGANGVQLAACDEPRGARDGDHDHGEQQANQQQLGGSGCPQPAGGERHDGEQQQRARPAPGRVGRRR